MKQSSDLGLILPLWGTPFALQSHEELAKVLHEYLQQFDIRCASDDCQSETMPNTITAEDSPILNPDGHVS